MTNRQNDRTSRQDDIENRHQVIFDPDYRSEAPGLPSLLVNRPKSENSAFILLQLQFLKSRIFNTFSAANELLFNELSLYQSLSRPGL